MVEILEGIHTVEQSPADGWDLEGYILDCGDDLVIVDTGFTASDISSYRGELEAMGRDWTEVSAILITHGHGDHIENLTQIKDLTGADVMAGTGDVASIEARTGVKVDRALDHGDLLELCGGIEVVLVPGHSEGNLCFFLVKQKTMIAGDTIFGDERGNLLAPPEKYCVDVGMAADEISRLLEYDFDRLLLSHGENLMRDAKRMVERLCAQSRV
ncbi:MAG: MBL fold metallo-hydrolase [Candidatus Bathyarchaeota archaeon]|jgi:glyoxylase-like metal-dependent hydrolase (beta-lactamase superfamily II)